MVGFWGSCFGGRGAGFKVWVLGVGVVHINQLSNEDTLNSKSEWTYTKLPSATIR